MKKDEKNKSIPEIIREKIFLIIVALGCLIIIFFAGSLVFDYFFNRTEWTVSVSGDELRLEDTVDVLDYYDGSYIKTIHCMEKQEKLWFIGGRSRYEFTILGPGIAFNPVIKYHKLHPEVIENEKYSINFEIYRNGDRWDATVTIGGYTEHYEDIEENEICMDFYVV